MGLIPRAIRHVSYLYEVTLKSDVSSRKKIFSDVILNITTSHGLACCRYNMKKVKQWKQITYALHIFIYGNLIKEAPITILSLCIDTVHEALWSSSVPPFCLTKGTWMFPAYLVVIFLRAVKSATYMLPTVGNSNTLESLRPGGRCYHGKWLQ